MAFAGDLALQKLLSNELNPFDDPTFEFIFHSIFQYSDDVLILSSVLILTSVTLLFLFHQNEEKKFQKQLNACFKDLSILIENTNTHGLFVRLAWSDAVNYDTTVHFWPHCGGCNGSIRFISELDEPANAGLISAIDLLTPLKKQYNRISWADIIQMAGAVAIELCNGPQLDLQYGRLDVPIDLRNLSRKEEVYYAKKWNKTGRIVPVDSEDIRNRMLPKVFPPYPLGELNAETHLQIITHRLGLSYQEMVALCGAHTLGRAFKERSGVCPFHSGDQGATSYTKLTSAAKTGGRELGQGLAGGCSWTKNWLEFDNSYFKRPFEDPDNAELLWLPTDQALLESTDFRRYFLLYAEDAEQFRSDYQEAHIKMSQLGSRFGRYVLKVQRK